MTSVHATHDSKQRPHRSAGERIVAEVRTWPGISVAPGSRGELSVKLGRREIGHLHGDHAAHFAFPKSVWDKLASEGRIEPHPVFPDRRGPAARRIHDERDERDVIALLRINYERRTGESA